MGEKKVTFPNSMVDRITPVTKPGKVTDVCCEDFIQWVIEDNFIAGRPAWEKVGVTFTHDVTPYEIMKLSLLNASHTLLSYPAYMEGFRKVDAVMADERYRAMIKLFMNRDVTPYVPVPEGVDLEAYKDQLIERFQTRRSAIRYHGFAAMALLSLRFMWYPYSNRCCRMGRIFR